MDQDTLSILLRFSENRNFRRIFSHSQSSLGFHCLEPHLILILPHHCPASAWKVPVFQAVKQPPHLQSSPPEPCGFAPSTTWPSIHRNTYIILTRAHTCTRPPAEKHPRLEQLAHTTRLQDAVLHHQPRMARAISIAAESPPNDRMSLITPSKIREPCAPIAPESTS